MTVLRLPDRQHPETEHVSSDQWGRPMYRFVVEYPHLQTQSGQDRVWSVTIWAYDQEDAEARLDAIRGAGRLAGQVLETGNW
jgi:hypothetical protein